MVSATSRSIPYRTRQPQPLHPQPLHPAADSRHTDPHGLPAMGLPLFLTVSHFPHALLAVFLVTLALHPRLALFLLIALFPLLALPSLRQVGDVLEDLCIAAPSHFKPHLRRTRWRPEGKDGLVRLQSASGDKRRMVLVTGADGGIGLETTVALLLAGCDVLMGIKDLDLSGYWPQLQERLDSRIVDELVKRRQGLDASADPHHRLRFMDGIGHPLPFKCDFSHMRGARLAAEQVWTLVAERTSGDSAARMVGAITHYVGTVGIGCDRPTAKGKLYSRYTENDDDIEYQLGVNAINPFVFTLLVWPLVARISGSSSAEIQASVDGRIVLINSIAHAWNSLPLAVTPRYESWHSVRREGERRWAAGRYNFSKLTQLLLLTSLEGISTALLSSLRELTDLQPHTAFSSPLLFSLHPGEVNTPFLDLMLPTWRCTWIERMTCLEPRQGAWTGLWACIVDLAGTKRARLNVPTSNTTIPSAQSSVQTQEEQSREADVGYHYLISICTLGKPGSMARDARLVRECWALVGSRLASFFESNDEVVAEEKSLTFQSWEKKVGVVVAHSS